MEIRITTKQILGLLLIIAWIIFLSLCVEAGGLIVSTFIALVLNPTAANYAWTQLDLAPLYNFDKGQFLVIGIFMLIVTVMKALIFYLIVKLLHDKKLDLTLPFNHSLARFTSLVAWLSVAIGLFSAWGARYSDWLISKGVTMPDKESMNLEGASIWLFMGITLFVIAQVFKRGIQIQTENELTV